MYLILYLFDIKHFKCPYSGEGIGSKRPGVPGDVSKTKRNKQNADGIPHAYLQKLKKYDKQCLVFNFLQG